MVKRLDAMIAEEADDASALAIPDRQRQAAEIQGDLLAVETWPGSCGQDYRRRSPYGSATSAPPRYWAPNSSPFQRATDVDQAPSTVHHRGTGMTRDVQPGTGLPAQAPRRRANRPWRMQSWRMQP
jgi:hypothetical protein